MKNGQKKRGWVWLTLLAVVVATAPPAQSAGSHRVYSPILNLLAGHGDAWSATHAATAGLRSRPTSASVNSRTAQTHSGLFQAMLAVEFIGVVSPLTPVSALILRELQQQPSPPVLFSLFQRPPPFSF